MPSADSTMKSKLLLTQVRALRQTLFDSNSPYGGDHMATFVASTSPQGAAQTRRVCDKRNCGGEFFVKFNEDMGWVVCPHCNRRQESNR